MPCPTSFAYQIFLITRVQIKLTYSFFLHTLHHFHLIIQSIIYSSFLHFPILLGLMVPDLEKPRVTEINVRMDCNGCVQKIKKALHGIHGIYEVYLDIAQQKLTIIGWADPERIVKAIRKTRKIATICSHSEPTEAAAQPTEQPPEGGSARPEAANPPPSEAPPAEAEPQPQSQPEVAPPAEPPKDQPPPEKPQSKPAPTPAATDANANQQPSQPSGPKDVGEVHEICHHPPDHGQRYGYVHSYGGPWSRRYPNSQGNFYPEPLSRHPNSQIFHHEPPQPAFATHSYNTYKPPPYVTEYEYVHSPPRFTHYSRIDHYNEDYHNNYSSGSSSNFYPEPLSRHPNSQVFHHEPPQPAFVTHSYNTYKRSPYVTEYEYVHSPPRYMHYSRIDHYNEDYHNNYSSGSSSSSSSNGNITSIFSDENPNACRIM